MELGDINQDGLVDIVVADLFDQSVKIIYQNSFSSGSFGEPVVIQIPCSSGNFANTIVIDDLDGDFDIDIAYGACGEIKLFTNNGGDDNWSIAAFGPGNYSSIEGVDIDGDDDIDLLTGTFGGDIKIFKNDEFGTYTESNSISINSVPYSLDSGDVDGDGDDDLVVGSYVDTGISDTVHIFYNDGVGGLSLGETHMPSLWVEEAALGDTDDDGDLDILVCNFLEGTVSIFDNSGSGNFSLVTAVEVGVGAASSGIGDFDGDGLTDVCAVNAGASIGDVSVYFRNGKGTYSDKYEYGSASVLQSIYPIDNDSDGDLDLFVFSAFESKVLYFNNDCTPIKICISDMDQNGVLNFFDVSAFLVLYQVGSMDVDFDGDGVLTFFDVSEFLVSYVSGCD